MSQKVVSQQAGYILLVLPVLWVTGCATNQHGCRQAPPFGNRCIQTASSLFVTSDCTCCGCHSHPTTFVNSGIVVNPPKDTVPAPPKSRDIREKTAAPTLDPPLKPFGTAPGIDANSSTQSDTVMPSSNRETHSIDLLRTQSSRTRRPIRTGVNSYPRDSGLPMKGSDSFQLDKSEAEITERFGITERSSRQKSDVIKPVVPSLPISVPSVERSFQIPAFRKNNEERELKPIPVVPIPQSPAILNPSRERVAELREIEINRENKVEEPLDKSNSTQSEHKGEPKSQLPSFETAAKSSTLLEKGGATKADKGNRPEQPVVLKAVALSPTYSQSKLPQAKLTQPALSQSLYSIDELEGLRAEVVPPKSAQTRVHSISGRTRSVFTRSESPELIGSGRIVKTDSDKESGVLLRARPITGWVQSSDRLAELRDVSNNRRVTSERNEIHLKTFANETKTVAKAVRRRCGCMSEEESRKANADLRSRLEQIHQKVTSLQNQIGNQVSAGEVKSGQLVQASGVGFGKLKSAEETQRLVPERLSEKPILRLKAYTEVDPNRRSILKFERPNGDEHKVEKKPESGRSFSVPVEGYLTRLKAGEIR